MRYKTLKEAAAAGAAISNDLSGLFGIHPALQILQAYATINIGD
jgi:hypothetical protein